MTILILEQLLNGLQFGLMLFLLTAGLTLVFGIMDLINLAHGSLYVTGAYLTATLTQATGSFLMAIPFAVAITAILGMIMEMSLLRTLYQRNHLSQVLATYALLLICNEAIRIIWGSQPLELNAPAALSGPVEIVPGLFYSSYRLVIIGVGAVLAALLYILITRTKAGMWVRAGASNRQMATVMGVNIKLLFTIVFGVGAALSAAAGALLGPLLSVQVGMGENILILAFVVVVIGGVGSNRGALVGALLVGLVDNAGRAALSMVLRQLLPPTTASTLGSTLSSILIYILMAAVLFWKPQGLFPARG